MWQNGLVILEKGLRDMLPTKREFQKPLTFIKEEFTASCSLGVFKILGVRFSSAMFLVLCSIWRFNTSWFQSLNPLFCPNDLRTWSLVTLSFYSLKTKEDLTGYPIDRVFLRLAQLSFWSGLSFETEWDQWKLWRGKRKDPSWRHAPYWSFSMLGRDSEGRVSHNAASKRMSNSNNWLLSVEIS